MQEHSSWLKLPSFPELQSTSSHRMTPLKAHRSLCIKGWWAAETEGASLDSTRPLSTLIDKYTSGTKQSDTMEVKGWVPNHRSPHRQNTGLYDWFLVHRWKKDMHVVRGLVLGMTLSLFAKTQAYHQYPFKLISYKWGQRVLWCLKEQQIHRWK